MTSERFALNHVSPGGGSPSWLAAVAASLVGLAALAVWVGVLSPLPPPIVAPPPTDLSADPVDRELDLADCDATDAERESAPVERLAVAPTDRAPLAVGTRAPRPGSERWHVERLRALAAADLAAFERQAHDRFDVAAAAEQFALLRVALAVDAALADELGHALLEKGRRGDRDLFSAAVTLLERFAARSNPAAIALLGTLSADEAKRLGSAKRREGE